jgi:hypothetical protein
VVELFILTYCGTVCNGGPDASGPCHWLSDLTLMQSLSPIAASVELLSSRSHAVGTCWRSGGRILERLGSVLSSVGEVSGRERPRAGKTKRPATCGVVANIRRPGRRGLHSLGSLFSVRRLRGARKGSIAGKGATGEWKAGALLLCHRYARNNSRCMSFLPSDVHRLGVVSGEQRCVVIEPEGAGVGCGRRAGVQVG